MPRLALALVASSPCFRCPQPGRRTSSSRRQLVGRAVLPADTFAAGPPSGAALGTAPINGLTPPFASQPVQGFSAVLDAGDGEYWAHARQRLRREGELRRTSSCACTASRPDFETAAGGSGTIDVGELHLAARPRQQDPVPDRPRRPAGPAADRRRLRHRVRAQATAHGDLWFGDEFGPYLLHTSATGRMLEAPIPLPGVKSPGQPDARRRRDAEPRPAARASRAWRSPPTATSCS